MKLTVALFGVGITNMGGAAGRHNLAVGVVLSVIGGVLVGIALTIA